MHGISLGFQVLALAFIPPMYVTSKPMFNIQPSSEQLLFSSGEKGVNGNAIQENGKQPFANGKHSGQTNNGIVNEGADLNEGPIIGVVNLREEQTPLWTLNSILLN